MQILVHLFAAKRWLRLAGFLLQLSADVRTERDAQFFQLVPLLLRPLPNEIPRSAQIGILAAQIRIARLTNADQTAELEKDFRAVATNPDSESLLGAFIGWLSVGPLSPKTTAAFAAEGAIRAARLYPEVRQRMPEVFEAATIEIHPASLIWAAVAFLSTADDVRSVVDLLCELTDEELRSTFANADLARGVEILTGRIWTVELDKAEGERTWEPVLETLDRLIRKAASAGVMPLLFAAQRAKATVLSDYLSKADEALALLAIDPEIHREPEELLRRHHLSACVQLDHVGPAAALSEFNRALAIDADAEAVTYADAARRAAEAAAKLEQWSDAIRYAIRAIVALKKARLPFERIDMITELSWLQWQRGNRQRAAAALGAVTDSLTANVEVDSERFRESFRKAGHVIGWIGGVAEDEPPKVAWGNTPYNAPYVGFASRSRSALATADAPILPPLLLHIQGKLEAAVGLKMRALEHYRRARAAARAHGIDVLECIAASAQGETAASFGNIDESVEASLFGVRSFIVAGQAARGFTFKNQNIEATWASAPITSRAPLERIAFWKTIAAALVGALARRSGPIQIVNLIEQLKAAFSNNQLAEPSHWQDLLNLAETHFDPTASLASIGQTIAASQGQTERLTILYLALINHPDAAPRDICGAEVVCLSAFKSWEPMARSPLVDFATVVHRSWQEIVRDRAFALNAPRLLRKALDENAAPSVPNAARILMVAQAATATRLDRSLHEFLARTAEAT